MARAPPKGSARVVLYERRSRRRADREERRAEGSKHQERGAESKQREQEYFVIMAILLNNLIKSDPTGLDQMIHIIKIKSEM